MKLISCDECGLVYDQDKIYFYPRYDDHSEPIMEHCEWSRDDDDYVAVFQCRCGTNVRKEA